MNKQKKYKQRTLEVHAGEEVDPVTGARATPMLLKKKVIYTPEYPIQHWMFWKKEWLQLKEVLELFHSQPV